MAEGGIETYHGGGLWHNRIVGSSWVLDSYELKDEARSAGRRHAIQRGMVHQVRYLSGRVEAVYDYHNVDSSVSA